jgi:energy-converting hydrogenase Eha subunit E
MLEHGKRLSSLEDDAAYNYSIINIAITNNYGTRVNLLFLGYNAYLSLMGFVESSA